MTAPLPAPPSSKSCGGKARPARGLGSHFARFFRTSSTRQPSRTRRPRRSHTNDVNPAQTRHVHKPPAHKRLKRPRRRRDPFAPIAGTSMAREVSLLLGEGASPARAAPAIALSSPRTRPVEECTGRQGSRQRCRSVGGAALFAASKVCVRAGVRRDIDRITGAARSHARRTCGCEREIADSDRR